MKDNKRLTFAIISHPDAGKTTMTEKLLLFGGAIHAAGAVKSGKNARKTVSDFMEMEKSRGISISTSVMGFDYRNRKVNILDTPGHADFSEDTYRTLTAVDSSLMVIDSVKGVEERTRKLCEICRMRKTPIITFMNKFDREGKEAVELLDEIEAELKVTVCPMSWPVGQGRSFKGVYSIYEKRLILFDAHGIQDESDSVEISDLYGKELDERVGSAEARRLREELELITEVYPSFEQEAYIQGELTPVFFGSAINNFGIRELLDCFVDIAPGPGAFEAEGRMVQPREEQFSGFVFKIHANLDPRHRDRIAFMRVVSGEFQRNKAYIHTRTGKTYKTANPTAFMAQSREVLDRAVPGDIIGLHDTGSFKIGDGLSEGEMIQFKGIPSFAPQIFRTVVNKDPLRDKQFRNGLDQLAEEGVVQIFTKLSTKTRLIGVVGPLQLDVIQHRLINEYKATCIFEPVDFQTACWIDGEDKAVVERFSGENQSKMAMDVRGQLVYLAPSRWMLDRTVEEYPGLRYYFTSDLK